MMLYYTALCSFLLWMLATFCLFYDFKRKNPIPENSGKSLKDIIPTDEQTDYVMKGLSLERENSLFKKFLYYAQGIFFGSALCFGLLAKGMILGFLTS